MYLTQPAEKITYEVGHDQPLHPDPQVASRMVEYRISTSCPLYGCKIYKDPWSEVRVLAHNSAYGCYK